MRRFLRKYVFANVLLKLLALSISLLLWTTYTSEPFAEIGVQVPLEFTSIPSRLEISGDVPTVVHVRVRGRSVLLRRLIPADLNLRLDMKDEKPGDVLIRLTPDMVGAPYGANVVQITPSDLHVTLVQRRDSAADSK
jgi:hypothetical protein